MSGRAALHIYIYSYILRSDKSTNLFLFELIYEHINPVKSNLCFRIFNFENEVLTLKKNLNAVKSSKGFDDRQKNSVKNELQDFPTSCIVSNTICQQFTVVSDVTFIVANLN